MAIKSSSSETMQSTSPPWRHHFMLRVMPIVALGTIYLLNGERIHDAQGRTGMDKLLNEPVISDEPLIFNEPGLKETEKEEGGKEGETLPVMKEAVEDPLHLPTDPFATPSAKSAKAKDGDTKSKGAKAEPKSKAAKAEGAKAEKHDGKSKGAKGGSKSKKSKSAKAKAASAKAEKHDGKATKGSAKSEKSKEKSKGGAKSEKSKEKSKGDAKSEKKSEKKSASAKSAKAAVEKIALEVEKEIDEEVEGEYINIEDTE